MTYLCLNEVGYVAAFTGTVGTYDKNLPKYREFLKRLEFATPAGGP